jgi:hypothetical protein
MIKIATPTGNTESHSEVFLIYPHSACIKTRVQDIQYMSFVQYKYINCSYINEYDAQYGNKLCYSLNTAFVTDNVNHTG